MTPRAALLQIIGFILIVALVSRLPDAVFDATRTFLLVGAAVLLLAVAAAVGLRKVRLSLFDLFGVRYVAEGPGVATPEEMRGLVRPILVAFVGLLVVVLAGLLR